MLQQIDIRGGQMTFAQRKEIGMILENPGTSEYSKFKACMESLHPGVTVSPIKDNLLYFYEVVAGIKYWIEREQEELKYKPTPEEYVAGIETLTLQCGEFSTLMAVAEKFSQDPDTVLQWKYGKVYNILYSNLRNFLYRDKLHKEQQRRAESKSRAKQTYRKQ